MSKTVILIIFIFCLWLFVIKPINSKSIKKTNELKQSGKSFLMSGELGFNG
jgi:hypothetical protein